MLAVLVAARNAVATCSAPALVTTALLAGATVTAAAAAADCPSPPAPVRDLDIPPFYGRASNNRIDMKQLKINADASKPVTDYLDTVARSADLSLTAATSEDRKAHAACTLAWLEPWARGEAWLGHMATQQSEYQRKWDLAGIALAYLKVKREAAPAQRAVIEPWIDRIAKAARAYFDDGRQARNNHWYWLGLGLGATSLATGSDWAWNEARSIMADAVRDIRADGALPRELARGPRAIHYHAFSVMPLGVLAELGAARGEDWYALGEGALHRLVSLTARGFEDPSIFDRIAGVAQQPSKGAGGTGWLPLYKARFPGGLDGVRLEIPAYHRWTGGDVMLLRALLQSGGH